MKVDRLRLVGGGRHMTQARVDYVTRLVTRAERKAAREMREAIADKMLTGCKSAIKGKYPCGSEGCQSCFDSKWIRYMPLPGDKEGDDNANL